MKNYRISPSPQAAFRGYRGVTLSGEAHGELLVFRLPLNPTGTARRMVGLKAHRAKFVLRASCRGVARYILKTESGDLLYSPWVAFSETAKDSLGAENPEDYLTQTWSAHWQPLELPDFEPYFPSYQGVDGSQPLVNEGVEPYCIDFRCLGADAPFEIHVDEISIDLGHLMAYKRRHYERMPVMNVWPNSNFPRESNFFDHANAVQVSVGLNMNNAFVDLTQGVHGDPRCEFGWNGQTSGSKSTEIQLAPKVPLWLGTSMGVVGVKVTLRSTGTRSWKLKLLFSEEKLRDSKDGEEPHETFATHLPLDFRGVRSFEIPLSYLGLPERPNARRHNKVIDGNLKLEHFSLVPVGMDDAPNSDPALRHVVELVELEQWVDEEQWLSALPHLKDHSSVETPSLNIKQSSLLPVILRDMEHEVFNKTVDRGDHTVIEVFEQNEASALRGHGGVQLRLTPEDTSSRKKVDLEATIFLSQSETSPLDPLEEYAPTIMVSSDADLKMSVWVKDARGQVFASPFERYDTTVSKQNSNIKFNPSQLKNKAVRLDFEALRGELSKYQFVRGGRRVEPRYPMKPYAIQILAPKTNQEVNVFLDDLGCWNVVSKPKLWRQAQHEVPAYVESESDRQPSPIFSRQSGWGIDGLFPMALELNHGTVDDKAFQAQANRSMEKYKRAQEQLNILFKLDRNTQKDLNDFFRPHDRAPQLSVVPQLLSYGEQSDGLQFGLSWAEQEPLKPWLWWGCATVLLKPSEPRDADLWIPVHKGIVGMKLSHWTSGHLETWLRLVFVDDLDRYFVRSVSLDQEGLFENRVTFDSSGFEILTKGGRRHKNQESPRSLRFCSTEIFHAPSKAQHAGVQHLKLYPLEWIKER